MTDYGRLINSIVVTNLPANYNERQLEELFSKFGRIVSSKILPNNSNFDGSCGVINYAESDSCIKAVENMNNFVIDRCALRVNHSIRRMETYHISNNNSDQLQNDFRNKGESNQENSTISSLSAVQNRFGGFRPASERSSTSMTRLVTNSTPLNTNESGTFLDNNKVLWQNINNEQQKNQNSFINNTVMNVREHDSFVTNMTYYVYLSNLEIPNIVFAATLDDYVNATLLITQMNKHEQLVKVKKNSYETRLDVGQFCAALFNGDWYRARILEINENRAHVQYIDWGNTGWCDSILEIRPLPVEYSKDPILCVKCVLDGISTQDKLSDEQTNAILEILVLDVKLEMIVLRIENNTPYVQLTLGQQNLNAGIRAILRQSSLPTTTIMSRNSNSQIINFDSNKPNMSASEIYSVQLTVVDTGCECFHVLLMRDCLPIIINVLKNWDANKQPLTKHPKSNMLVCAQYDADNLWYRAWIKNITESGFHVYFVDFGNEETVSINQLSECPDILRNIPWQSVQIRLANVSLTDDERYLLLRNFETSHLEMKILSKNQDIYSVELSHDGKSLTEYIRELRQKKEQQTQLASSTNKKLKESAEAVRQSISNMIPMSNKNLHSKSLSAWPAADECKQFVEKVRCKILSPLNTLTDSSNTETKLLSINERNNKCIFNDNITTIINEQRQQNCLLEQVTAAINTTNTLLTQLVQRWK